jgi:ankyrin repeat protein
VLLQARDEHGRTALHYCFLYEANEIARSLLRKGADRSVQDCNGMTALDIGIRRGRIQDSELLVLMTPAPGS